MDLPNPPPNPDGLGTPCGYTELRQVPWAPDDYVNPQGVDPTTFPRMPLPVAVPYQFPPIKAAPANLRPRHPDQETQLGLLDVDYQQEEHNDIRDMALLDANHMQENGSYGKKARTAAYAVLHEHSKLRLPYIHMSAERLQAATGMRNDHPFGKFRDFSSCHAPHFNPISTPIPFSSLFLLSAGNLFLLEGSIGRQRCRNLSLLHQWNPTQGQGEMLCCDRRQLYQHHMPWMIHYQDVRHQRAAALPKLAISSRHAQTTSNSRFVNF